jgi:hypothetical protein
MRTKGPKFQIPNSNIQKSSKLQTSNFKLRDLRLEVWSLKFGIFLDVGGWNLEFS